MVEIDRSTTTARRLLAAGVALAVGIGALVGAGAPPAAAEPVGGVETWETAVVPLPNGAIAADESRGVVLVAVRPIVPGLGNHLVELDPETGALGRSVSVVADPQVVAVADDGSRAYVGGLGSSHITEVDLETFTVTRTIFLGNDTTTGGHYAEEIEVQPGHPDVIAVAWRNLGGTPRHEGVAIYDDGVQRTAVTPGHTGPNRITWSDDPATIYGYDSTSSAHQLFVLTVGSGGVTVAPAISGLIEEEDVDIEHAGHEIVATNGRVVDDETLTAADPYPARGQVEVDEAGGTTYFLDRTTRTLTSHDTATRLQTGSLDVPSIAPRDLVAVGPTLVSSGPSGVLLLGEGVTASGFALPAAPESRVRTWGEISVALDVAELAAAPDGEHVYGVVRAGAPRFAQRVVEIATATGQITRSVAVGADPHRIAISGDGSTLLVGHAGANKLTELATAGLTVRRAIAIPDDELADDIDGRPGTSATFAVVLVDEDPNTSPALTGQIIVQDGVVLPDRGPGHSGGTSVAFTADPDRLYGVNGGSSEFALYTYEVGPTGVRKLSMAMDISSGFGSEVVATDDRLFTTSGRVIDPTVPAVVGTMPAGRIVPVPSQDRLLVSTGTIIRELELGTLAEVGSWMVSDGASRDAVLVGSQVAMATTHGKVLLVPIGDPAPAVTSLDPATGVPSGGTAVTITGTGLRGATAVAFGETPAAAFTVVSDTEITAVAPAHAEGEVDVTVTTPGGTSDGGSSAGYTYAPRTRSAEESWVAAAFEDFLGREPSPTEIAEATARLDAGVPRSTLARELATSDEWISHLVSDLYADTLGRTPTAGEVAYWADELRSQRRSVAEVAASFYASAEYVAGVGGGTTSSWIADLYPRLMGRAATPGDVGYWSGRATAKGRGWVALQLFQSLETRRARVGRLYVALLGRTPDVPGRDYWAERLLQEGDIALARNLASSSEYLARAHTRFP